MSAIEIKAELQQMIEQEKDMSVLEAIRTILQKTSLNPMLKEKLTTRALKSEKDITAGHLFSKEDVAQRTQRR
jgi:sialic acid synthase SpsE